MAGRVGNGANARLLVLPEQSLAQLHAREPTAPSHRIQHCVVVREPSQSQLKPARWLPVLSMDGRTLHGSHAPLHVAAVYKLDRSCVWARTANKPRPKQLAAVAVWHGHRPHNHARCHHVSLMGGLTRLGVHAL